MKKFRKPLSRIAAATVIAMTAASLSVSCVDEEFRLDDISGEITVGQGDVTIPLGFLKTKTLGEIIGEDIDELTVDANGNYSISYSGGDRFDIDGIKTQFALERSAASTTIAYPDMRIDDLTGTIDKRFSLDVPAALQSITRLPAQISATVADSGEFDCNIELAIPKQIKAVNEIMLDGDKGSRFDITLSLNGLAPINGGGTAKVSITVPDGYELLDENGYAVSGNVYTATKPLANGAKSLTFGMYVRSIDTSRSKIAGGTLNIEDKMQYSISYAFTAKSGITFDPKNAPTLSIHSDLKYGDANVTVNEIALDEGTHSLDERLTVENIIDEIKNVSEVSFKNTNLPLHIGGLDWVSRRIAEATYIDIVLPEIFVLAENPEGYNPQTRTLTASLARLREGLPVRLQALRIDAADSKPSNGKLEADFSLLVKIGSIPQDMVLNASELVHDGVATIEMAIENTTVTIDGIVGTVDYRRTETSVIELGEIADYDIEVSDFDVSPAITFDVVNPLGVPLTAAVRLIPVYDGADIAANSVTVDGVRIAAATRNNGTTTAGKTHIVIAKGDRKGDFGGAGTEFREADITRLFKGAIPQQIRVELDIASDTSAEHTLYAADNYSVDYGYSVDIPLDFGDKFDISYSDTATGLSDTFSDITDKNISVGDITIIASVENSTPLDLKVSAELVDIDGNPTGAKAIVDINNDTAYGSEDGKVRTSEIRIALSLGDDNSIKSLEEVDGAKFTLNALSPKGGIRLNKNQTLSAKLKLNIKGGITADINEL